MNLTPIHDNIIFQFKDQVKNGFFVDAQTDSGLVLDLGGNHERSGKYCRIGIVKAVGEKATDVCEEGDEIIIDHLMWTEGFKFKGGTYWMTQPRCVMGKMGS